MHLTIPSLLISNKGSENSSPFIFFISRNKINLMNMEMVVNLKEFILRFDVKLYLCLGYTVTSF